MQQEHDEDEMSDLDEEDVEERVKKAFHYMYENCMEARYVLLDGILEYANVTVDFDAVQMYTDTDGAPDLVKALPENATFRGPKVFDYKNRPYFP